MFFTDEWTGQTGNKAIDAIRDALQAIVDGVLEEVLNL